MFGAINAPVQTLPRDPMIVTMDFATASLGAAPPPVMARAGISVAINATRARRGRERNIIGNDEPARAAFVNRNDFTPLTEM